MSYQTYTTEAIVLQSYDSGTADRTYRLFTRHAGMVLATARSVREERSRQRCALQDYTHITVSLIRGKTGWRIGSVEAQQNFYLSTNNRLVRKSILSVCRTIRQYVHGEDPQSTLYDAVIEGMQLLSNDSLGHRAAWEIGLTARILALLGYVATTPDIDALITHNPTRIDVDQLLRAIPTLAGLITKAEESSHLSS